jgi:hypothetical protein
VNYSRLLPALTLSALLFASCSATNKTAPATATSAKRDAKVFVVSVASVAFLHHGPRAGREPDKRLSKETVVTLIRPSFGYSKVEIAATGEKGYVSSDEIRPASSNLVASVSAPKVDPMSTPATPPPVEQFNLNSNDPRLVPPPEDLPSIEAASPPPEE